MVTNTIIDHRTNDNDADYVKRLTNRATMMIMTLKRMLVMHGDRCMLWCKRSRIRKSDNELAKRQKHKTKVNICLFTKNTAHTTCSTGHPEATRINTWERKQAIHDVSINKKTMTTQGPVLWCKVTNDEPKEPEWHRQWWGYQTQYAKRQNSEDYMLLTGKGVIEHLKILSLAKMVKNGLLWKVYH